MSIIGAILAAVTPLIPMLVVVCLGSALLIGAILLLKAIFNYKSADQRFYELARDRDLMYTRR